MGKCAETIVRQSDTIIPKGFAAALENVTKNLDWGKMIIINKFHISYSWFVNHFLILNNSLEELKYNVLKYEIKVNLKKSKNMFNRFAPTNKRISTIILRLKTKNNYAYLGELLTLDNNIVIENKSGIING